MVDSVSNATTMRTLLISKQSRNPLSSEFVIVRTMNDEMNSSHIHSQLLRKFSNTDACIRVKKFLSVSHFHLMLRKKQIANIFDRGVTRTWSNDTNEWIPLPWLRIHCCTDRTIKQSSYSTSLLYFFSPCKCNVIIIIIVSGIKLNFLRIK